MHSNLESKIASLKLANRYLSAWLVVVSMGLGLQLLTGFMGQEKVLDVTSITLRDGEGRPRIVMGCPDNRPLVALLSESGAHLGEFTIHYPLLLGKDGTVGSTVAGVLSLHTSGAKTESNIDVGASRIAMADSEGLRTVIESGELTLDAFLGYPEENKAPQGFDDRDRAELSLSIGKHDPFWSLLGNRAYESLSDAEKERLSSQWLPMPRIQLGRKTGRQTKERPESLSLIEIGLVPGLVEGAASSGDVRIGMDDVTYRGEIEVRTVAGHSVRQSLTMNADALRSMDIDKKTIQRFP